MVSLAPVVDSYTFRETSYNATLVKMYQRIKFHPKLYKYHQRNPPSKFSALVMFVLLIEETESLMGGNVRRSTKFFSNFKGEFVKS